MTEQHDALLRNLSDDELQAQHEQLKLRSAADTIRMQEEIARLEQFYVNSGKVAMELDAVTAEIARRSKSQTSDL